MSAIDPTLDKDRDASRLREKFLYRLFRLRLFSKATNDRVHQLFKVEIYNLAKRQDMVARIKRRSHIASRRKP